MKKFLCVLLIAPLLSLAQEKDSVTKVEYMSNKEDYNSRKNNIKVNLTGFAFNNYNITYERQIFKHISLSLGYNYIPNGNFPYQDKLKELNTDPSISFDNFTLGGYAITPELRFYTKKGMRGFYVAPYARYSSFDVSIPGNYTITYKHPISGNNVTETYKLTFSGNMNATSGGLMLGYQGRIGYACTIDIWIIGASYSGTTNRLNGIISPALPNSTAQAQLEQSLNSIDLGPYKISGKVPTLSTAYVDVTNWYGVRGLGLTLGFKF